MARSFSLKFLSFILVLTGLFIQPRPSQAKIHVPLEGQAAMAGNSGAFSYSIPIQVPPGRNGLAPSLALSYNSRMGNGPLGVGWSLPIGYVMRNTKHGLDYNCENSGTSDPCFIYMVGGSAAELMPRPDWCGDCYGARVEGAFTRFRFISNQYWVATDKGGTRYALGPSTLSRQDGAPGVFKWMLDSVTDTHGNDIRYHYIKDQGQIYIDGIDYQTNHIRFEWDKTSRADKPLLYTSNVGVSTAYRLDKIDIFANWNGSNGIRVRKYDLLYCGVGASCAASNTGRSLLGDVRQLGRDGGTLSQIKLNWKQGGTGFALTETTGVIDLGWGGNRWWVDHNGDSKSDYCRLVGNSGSHQIFCTLSTGSGFGATVTTGVIDPGSGGNRWWADHNGDGKPDYCRLVGNQIFCTLSTGSGFGATVTTGVIDPGWGGNRWWTDHNEDGKSDYCRLVGNSGSHQIFCTLSTGSGFGTTVTTGVIDPGWAGSRWWVDHNGDNKSDYCRLVGNSGSHQIFCTLSTGSGFGATVTTGVIDPGWADGRWWADHNGDGRSDYCRLVGNSGSHQVFCTLSAGSGFGATVTTGVIDPGWGGSRWFVDHNGDGKSDYCRLVGNHIFCTLSTGSGFGATVTTGVIDLGSGGNRWFVDHNGDGKSDYCRLVENSGNNQMYCTLVSSGADSLLTSISNGIRGNTAISYKPSSSYWTPNNSKWNMPFVTQNLSTITSCDNHNGTNCIGHSSTTGYAYNNGYFNRADHEFRGFGYITTKNEINGNTTETWHFQGNGSSTSYEDDASASPGYMQGKQSKLKTWLGAAGSGILVSESTPSYQPGTVTGPFFTPLKEQKLIVHESGSSRTTRSSFDYDLYGNVKKESHYGDTSAGGDEKTITRTFSPNDSDKSNGPWILGLPKTESLYNGIGETDLRSRTTFYYDGIGNGAAGCNQTSTNQLATRGELTRVVRWLSNGSDPEVRTAYDSYGNLVCTKDAKGNLSTIRYDGGSNTFPIEVKNTLGHKVTTQYYGVDNVPANNGLYGQVKSVIDANGQTSTSLYDQFGRPVKSTAPNGYETTTFYESFGSVGAQRIRTNNSLGLQSWTYFDGFGRTTRAEQDVAGGRTEVFTTYNNLGQVTSSTTPRFVNTGSTGETRFEYDARGRQNKVIYPDNTASTTSFGIGWVIGTNAKNQKKKETRDALGRLVRVDEYDLAGIVYATTRYEYDILGNLLKVTDNAGNITTMQYDTLSRKTGMDDPDMGVWGYLYDANGNLREQTDAKGQKLFFQYDVLNRIRQKDFNGLKTLGTGDVRYTYDIGSIPGTTSFSIGRLSQVNDSSGSTRFAYDFMGRSSRSDKIVDGVTYTTQTSYDIASRVSSVTYPDNDIVRYAYNGPTLDRVYNNAGTKNYVRYEGYNAFGQPSKIAFGNGVATDYSYANAGNSECSQLNQRLCRITTKASGGATYQNVKYNYDSIGNVANIIDNINTQSTHTQQNASFGYDHLNRLTTASGPYGGINYAYDSIGNMTCNSQISSCGTFTNTTSTNASGQVWVYESIMGFPFQVTLTGTVVCNGSDCGITKTTTTSNYSYPGSGPNSVRPHAVTNVNGQIYTYDANGNMISRDNKTMTYDTENRMTQVVNAAGTTNFVYDGDGGRVKKITTLGTTVFIGKLFECNAPCNSGSSITSGSKHIFAGSTRIATLPITQANNEINYFHPDHLGSTAFVTDQAGAITAEYTYLPFGATYKVSTVVVNTWNDYLNPGQNQAEVHNYLYTNQQKDHETGLYFYNARYYDPVIGRFTQADTIVPGASDPQAFNRYAYVLNNPINLIDPSGHFVHKSRVGRSVSRIGRQIGDEAGRVSRQTWGATMMVAGAAMFVVAYKVPICAKVCTLAGIALMGNGVDLINGDEPRGGSASVGIDSGGNSNLSLGSDGRSGRGVSTPIFGGQIGMNRPTTGRLGPFLGGGGSSGNSGSIATFASYSGPQIAHATCRGECSFTAEIQFLFRGLLVKVKSLGPLELNLSLFGGVLLSGKGKYDDRVAEGLPPLGAGTLTLPGGVGVTAEILIPYAPLLMLPNGVRQEQRRSYLFLKGGGGRLRIPNYWDQISVRNHLWQNNFVQ